MHRAGSRTRSSCQIVSEAICMLSLLALGDIREALGAFCVERLTLCPFCSHSFRSVHGPSQQLRQQHRPHPRACRRGERGAHCIGGHLQDGWDMPCRALGRNPVEAGERHEPDCDVLGAAERGRKMWTRKRVDGVAFKWSNETLMVHNQGHFPKR